MTSKSPLHQLQELSFQLESRLELFGLSLKKATQHLGNVTAKPNKLDLIQQVSDGQLPIHRFFESHHDLKEHIRNHPITRQDIKPSPTLDGPDTLHHAQVNTAWSENAVNNILILQKVYLWAREEAILHSLLVWQTLREHFLHYDSILPVMQCDCGLLDQSMEKSLEYQVKVLQVVALLSLSRLVRGYALEKHEHIVLKLAKGYDYHHINNQEPISFKPLEELYERRPQPNKVEKKKLCQEMGITLQKMNEWLQDRKIQDTLKNQVLLDQPFDMPLFDSQYAILPYKVQKFSEDGWLNGFV